MDFDKTWRTITDTTYLGLALDLIRNSGLATEVDQSVKVPSVQTLTLGCLADINSETRVTRARAWRWRKREGGREREKEKESDQKRERERTKERKGTKEKERERSIGQECIHLAPPQVTPTCAIPSVGRHAYACGTDTQHTCARACIHARALLC